MKKIMPKKLFYQILFFFLVLGVFPVLLVALILSLPYHFDISWYKRVVGLLLIFSTVSTLCLAALVTRLLKGPLDNILEAQSKIKEGNLKFRLAVSDASSEVHQIYKGFNQMAEGLEDAAKQERIMFEQQLLVKIAQQVAHDIRSPLSSLKTFSEYFRHLNLPDENYSDYYNLLGLSIKRLNGIVDGLLEKNTKNIGTSSYFSLYQVLDELVGEYENQEQFKKITFEKKYSDQAIFLSGNARKLQRCFGNIIKNAIEAMNYKGTVIIRVTENCDMASISIEDTGPGISVEKLNHVLQGGFSEGKADGHGIGMTVVKETVTTHGGRLSASSQLGKGTSFLIELPLSKNLTPRRQNLSSSPQEVFTLTCQSVTVLIVDDDENMREQWRLILKKHGKEAVLCSSYEDCELILSSHLKMTTAIVDYHFENSEKNGLDVVEFLKKNGFTHLSLCTAEYWKPSIQNLAKKFEIGLCPKPLPHVKIVGPRLREDDMREFF